MIKAQQLLFGAQSCCDFSEKKGEKCSMELYQII